ncbi:Luciferase-like monooxygenase [Beutenbergia cavernae DSM 12333]|uniref:Luciferase-like monooxygenase n=1 Tax=Beutenbergia cavernae (strain ATCC BAA-8 / DSM 12333 / CCUG 43141 / JCM 11478 / NBRC 16432 / NCIMB 13614 / HKI 0122) TaxID=471853 RepID=C5C008_BEUC1|nr:LLM class flavin-dependent oxidoreductase [Beutenbergia cavernae]ACQ81338.1 Luciferase-like monooxygenase [Beutenbergia cavernae DSM 12333]
MEYGAHLPLVDLDDRGWTLSGLTSYARTAQQLGFRALVANDHLAFQRPWLDGLVALASVVEASGDLTLATTVALPVVRGPAALSKAAAALDVLSGGRFVLGMGPGSSVADLSLAGVDIGERWPRFEEAVRAVRVHLGAQGWPEPDGRFYPGAEALSPGPMRPGGPPVWIGSWGSPAGLRRVVRLGDGWLASAYNTTPPQVAAGRTTLYDALAAQPGRTLTCAVATMWTWVTEDERDRAEVLARLSRLLNRPEEELGPRLLVGSVETCAELARAYADAGVDLLLVWPLADHERQLELLMREVVPLVRPAGDE